MTYEQLGTDADTAFRLATEDGRTAPLAKAMGIWNVLAAKQSDRFVLDDLPAHMRREGDRLVSDVHLEPMTLSLDQILSEGFRLSGMHRAPDGDGWHRLSNVSRVAGGLVRDPDLTSIGSPISTMATLLREGPYTQAKRHADGDIRVRLAPRRDETVPTPIMDAVTVTAEFPDGSRRELDARATCGQAYRTVRDHPLGLVPAGTRVVFERGSERREATYDGGRSWIMADGRRMPSIDPADPVRHAYRHGHLVDAIVGFVSVSHRGRIFATVGTPRHSDGDEDAFIVQLDRKEADTHEEAIALLESRGDLDHIFHGLQKHSDMMGFWLTCLSDEVPETVA